MLRLSDRARRADLERGDQLPALPPFNSQTRTNTGPNYDRYGPQEGRTPRDRANEPILPNTALYNR